MHIFIRDAKPQSHHHFAITVEDLEPVYRRAEAMGALDGRSHGHHIIELPGDVAQTYVRDPAGNLMEIDTPGASRLPEWLRARCPGSRTCSLRPNRTSARVCSSRTPPRAKGGPLLTPCLVLRPAR